jgi:hypothetical protein
MAVHTKQQLRYEIRASNIPHQQFGPEPLAFEKRGESATAQGIEQHRWMIVKASEFMRVFAALCVAVL